MMIEAYLEKALETFANTTVPEMSEADFELLQQTINASWRMRGAWILQSSGCSGARRILEGDKYEYEPCGVESIHALFLLICLCTTIVAMVCAFAFFREDKEDQITPLCPQMVVKEPESVFAWPLSHGVDFMSVTDSSSQQPLCKISLDWPDPLRPGASGVAATVRLQSMQEQTLATVIARNVAVVGQGVALCRAGCEIFGFVEPEGQKYLVRHRTGVHLLTFVGDFEKVSIEGINPVGSKVCWFRMVSEGEVHGRVLQHVDAGLAMCSLMAIHVHRRLAGATLPPVALGERRMPRLAAAPGSHPAPGWHPAPGSPVDQANDAEDELAPHEHEKDQHLTLGSCAGLRPAAEEKDVNVEVTQP